MRASRSVIISTWLSSSAGQSSWSWSWLLLSLRVDVAGNAADGGRSSAAWSCSCWLSTGVSAEAATIGENGIDTAATCCLVPDNDRGAAKKLDTFWRALKKKTLFGWLRATRQTKCNNNTKTNKTTKHRTPNAVHSLTHQLTHSTVTSYQPHRHRHNNNHHHHHQRPTNQPRRRPVKTTTSFTRADADKSRAFLAM